VPDANIADSATAASDGGLDATPAMTFCDSAGASSVLFCEDFERGSPPFSFGEVINPSSGTFTFAPGRTGTTSRALRMGVPQAAQGRAFQLFKALGELGTPSASGRVLIDLDLDVRVEATGLEYTALAMLGMTSAQQVSFAGVATYDSGAKLGRLAPTDVRVPTGPDWHHVHTSIDVSATSRIVEVRIDGTVVGKETLGAAPVLTQLDVRVGVFFTSDNRADAAVLFDNVIVRSTKL